MVEEGEIEKRIKKVFNNLRFVGNSGKLHSAMTVPYSSQSILDFLRIINEAKKAFPKYSDFLSEIPVTPLEFDLKLKEYHYAIEKWFVTWFGEK